MYSSLIQEEKGRKIRIPPTYANLMYSVTLSNPSAATLISQKLLDPATSLGQQENWPDGLFSFQASLFYILPSVSSSFPKSPATSYTLSPLRSERHSLISKSSSAARHLQHQTWFKMEMLASATGFFTVALAQ